MIDSVVKESLTLQNSEKTELSQKTTKPTIYHNIDVVLAVEYGVKSNRGMAFRRWANSVLKEYLHYGCAVNAAKEYINKYGTINRSHF